MDRRQLESSLAEAFDGDERQCRVVARQARDLADSGRLAADLDVELTVETVVSNLADAPEDDSVAERWNWWVDALTLSHGGYHHFRVRLDLLEDEN